MRPDLTGPQSTLLATGNFDTQLLLQVANGSGTLVNLSARVSGDQWTHKVPGPDNPIASFSVNLVRQILANGTDSLAPLVADSLLNRDDALAYSPLLEMGRVVVFSSVCVAAGAARPADASFIEQFRGRITYVSGPEEYGTITIQCTDEAGVLAKTWTEGAAATAIQTVPLARTTIGLLDYFKPGTKEFDAADWTPSASLGHDVDVVTSYLNLNPGTTNPSRRSLLLHGADSTSGGYVWAEVSRNTANAGMADIYTSLSDQTAASEDAQGARFSLSGGDFGNSFDGNNEFVAGTETVYGTTTVNLGSGTINHLFAWVEPGAAAPACLAKRYTASGATTTDFTHGGPMSRTLNGKPGIGLGSSGSNVDFVVRQFFAMRDRYVWCYGLQPGQIAKILTSGGATRYQATADGTGLAKIDVFGDLTPLLSYKLSIYESDGVTLDEELHPIDGDGVVWGGDIWTTQVETTVPPIVLIGGTVVQDVLQGVVDREFGIGVIPIETPVAPSPAFVIDRDLNDLDDFVWNVVSGYAGKIGWLLWYRYVAGVAYLTFFEPARTKSVADFEFSRVYTVSQLDKDDENIRNVVEGISQTITGEVGGLTAKYSDSTSIAKYGNIRRYMRIVEEEGSVIVTQAMLDALVQAALSDLKDPDTIIQVTVPYFWPGEVSVDLYQFPALNTFFDDPTKFAPFSITHSGTGGAYRGRVISTMTLRGKPSAGQNIWRRLGGDESIPTTPLDPKWRWLPKAISSTLGGLWLKGTEQGKKINAVRFRTRQTAEPWDTEWSAPLRSAGATSKIVGGTLAIGEWEHEVVLSGSDNSYIQAEWQDEAGAWFGITVEAIDADSLPEFLENYPQVQALNILVEADDDTLSIRYLKTAGGGAAFSASVDDNEDIRAVPVPDGDEWTVDVTISNKIIADWGDPGEVTVTRTVTVTNAAEPAEGGVPTYLTIGLTEPTAGTDEVEIEVTANQAPTGYRFKAYASYEYIPYDDTTLPQSFGEIEITTQLNPSPLAMALPTSPTPFDFPTQFDRETVTPDGFIQMQFRFTIVDSAAPAGTPPIFNTGAYPFVLSWDCLVP
jgi:hypothetical protein